MALQPRELKLMAGFGATIFLLANAYGWYELSSREDRAKNETVKLTNSIKKYQGLANLKPEAEGYKMELAQWLKRYPTLNDRDTYLSNFVTKTAEDLGLTLSKNLPMPTEGLPTKDDRGMITRNAPFIKTGYQGEVNGDWKKVIEFAHLMENTLEFRWMKQGEFLTRKAEGQAQEGDADLVLKFQVQKWWHPDSEDLLADEAAALEAGAANPEAATSDAPKDTEQAPAPPVPTPTPEAAPAPAPAAPNQ